MLRASTCRRNKIGGIYAADRRATGVSGAGVPDLRGFFGSAGGGGVALGVRLADGRADQRPAGRPGLNGGNPPFSGVDLGHVARHPVAWHGQGTGMAGFSVPRRLIANLTTARLIAIATPSPRLAARPAAEGGLPPSRARACPHARRAGATWKLENRRPATFFHAGPCSGSEKSNVRDGKAGSGVRAVAAREGSAGETGRIGKARTGRGHQAVSFVAGRGGKSARLCPRSSQVNEIHRGVRHGSQGLRRSVIGLTRAVHSTRPISRGASATASPIGVAR